MNKLFRVTGLSHKIGAGLLIIYLVHLLAFHCLLSNPYDYLTTYSFSDYQTMPDKSSDCLLMLGDKTDVVKPINTTDGNTSVGDILQNGSFLQLIPVTPVTLFAAQHFYGYAGKLYRLLCSFRI